MGTETPNPLDVYNPILYVFLNKSLHMSAGKAAAQATHAAIMSMIKINSEVYIAKWVASPHRTVIVLEGRDEDHLRNIREYLLERDIQTVQIIDEGVNEIDPHVVTAVATRIMNKNNEEQQRAMSSFNLYRDPIEVTFKLDL